MSASYQNLLEVRKKAKKDLYDKDLKILKSFVEKFKTEEDIISFILPYFAKGYDGVLFFRSIFLLKYDFKKEINLLNQISNNFYCNTTGKTFCIDLVFTLSHRDDYENNYFNALVNKNHEEKFQNLKNMIIARKGTEEHINIISQLPKDILEKIIKEYI